MTGQELINGIASLAQSQGSYGRLFKTLRECRLRDNRQSCK